MKRKLQRGLVALKIRPIWYEKGKYEQIPAILNLITGNHDFYDSLESNEQKGSNESITNINNGNIGSQTVINIKYSNGNITH